MLSFKDLTTSHLAPQTRQLDNGRIVCLSGASGSGKSLLLRALADLDAHGGDVYCGDIAQSATPAHLWRQWVRLVPAESQWWADNVNDHFAQPAAPADLKALLLPETALDWTVSRLSSGEKQRLALLRAINTAPKALLLDEPTANLDQNARRATEEWLLEKIRANGWPTLWVAHDEDQILRVADHCWHMENGNLICREHA